MGLVIGISVPLAIAAASTAIALAPALWLAWLLVNRAFRGRRELGAALTAALALPAPVICYSVFFERPRGWSWGFTGAAVLAAAPMIVRAGRTAFSQLDPLYANSARTLGRSDWRIFWRLEWPLSRRFLAGAAALAFARVFAEFVAAVAIAR